MSECWTFVSRGGAAKNNRRNRNKKTTGGCPGLYKSADSFDRKTKHKGTRRRDQPNIDESKEKEIERAVLECINSLEWQFQSGEGFAFRLWESLSKSTHVVFPKSEDRSLHLREIVVYGIGNFSHEHHSAPMLQLAGALLLRKLSATSKLSGSISTCGEEDTTDCDNKSIHISFWRDQQETPIFYYEPCILQLEKELLEKVFYVHVLEGNDSGKLKVEDMRKQWCSKASPPTASPTEKGRNRTHTLFYMPHCPMRLYCNILWAHWGHFSQSSSTRTKNENTNYDFMEGVEENRSVSTNPLIIFGNSFHAYDDRTISSEQRLDPTNGILRLVPFTYESSVFTAAENKTVGDPLKMLERAFNDCNVISFSMNGCLIPDEPDEYFPAEDPHEKGELL